MPRRLLLAVSGGIDSMVMWHYVQHLLEHDHIEVAHMDFQLRGEESDADREFVQEMAVKWDTPVHIERTDAKQYAAEHKMGIQEAARDLRYRWLQEIAHMQDFDSIYTAHHQDDNIETFFINLLRGSGPKGLSGIRDDDERRIHRPLLDWSRKDIEVYAEQHDIPWREDSSNVKSDYLRNRIRHELIPLMDSLRPGFQKVMLRNMEMQAASAALIEKRTRRFRFDQQGLSDMPRDGHRFTMHAEDAMVFYDWLRPLGFRWEQIQDMLDVKMNGARFIAGQHVITRHMGAWEIERLKEEKIEEQLITLDADETCSKLAVQNLSEGDVQFEKSPLIECFQPELRFPLVLRPWKEADRMHPLGMKGQKLISDMLREAGLTTEQRKQALVLCEEEEIIWLVGHRISEDYKYQGKGPAWRLEYKPQ